MLGTGGSRMAYRESGSWSLSEGGCLLWECRARREFIYFAQPSVVDRHPSKESVRAVLAGSQLDGALAPVVIGGTIPASASTVIRVIPVGNNPVAASLR
jgi:hypothetical protein